MPTKIALNNSVLKFDDLVFTQLFEVAMGKTLAHVVATFHTGEHEEDQTTYKLDVKSLYHELDI